MDGPDERQREQDPATIPTDPQLAPEVRSGKRGASGAPETPGGSSRPLESDQEDGDGR